jgi:branched-chain amino acid aminotransferase
MIQEIGYKDSVIHVSHNSPIGQLVLDTINGVRIGKITDLLNWMVKVES